jgi:hypothetical protein
MVRFFFSANYNSRLERIEDHILATTESLDFVTQFLDDHDKVLQFIENNPNTPAIHPVTEDQTWVFGDGRYRMFFRVARLNNELHIYLTHLIDNREANLAVYPDNKIPTYDEE